MDPNPNVGNPEPMNIPVAGSAGAGEPDHAAEVSALKGWLRENLVSLIISAIAIGLVIKYLDPIDTLKVMLGLGLVIFIHELGHFLAAKWCDVHVKTFSIGFGPAVPFCAYKWGETTYMIGIIPLGGYVSMIGEGDNADGEEAEEDPRSFRKKTVGQRMLIISAGVVMNIILGMGCFVAAYMHGVQEKPAIVGSIESGSAAWRIGMRTDDSIVQIGSRKKPFFNDIRPIVMATQKKETVEIVIQHAGQNTTETLQIEPLKDEGAKFPQIGVGPPYRLTLLSLKQPGFKPTVPGTPAAAAANPGFEGGDRVIAMTNPDNPAELTELKPDPRDPQNGPDINDYYQRMTKLAGQPITFRVSRKDAGLNYDIVVKPAYRSDLGVRMQMGKVVALRKDGPAEKAGVRAWSEEQPDQGDRIKTVKVTEPGGKETWFAAGDVKNTNPNVTVRKLDPVLLPLELKKWYDRIEPVKEAPRTVRLEVLRKEGHQENTSAELTLTYDPAYRYDRETMTLANSPTPLGGLGLGYWIDAVVFEVEPGGPADGKLSTGDTVTAVRFKSVDDAGNVKPGEWSDIKANQWAWAEAAYQTRPPFSIDLKVKRGKEGGAVEEVSLEGREDTRWPNDDRGFVWQYDFRIQKATDISDALGMGAWRTVRFIREVYMNLYAMAFGRVSAKTMSGPLTIANVSYKFAGEDFWQFLLFMGMISVNLAVVNFLPIPVLDGGHIVFLLLEKILGRPVPEKIFAAAMWIGLAMILSLMLFVIGLDLQRMFF
ncbi:MAG: site-2 protease family protein [Planctomycetes bacterium]|nr:site-2 protease family protein [Planctomycetota bacterium]